MVFTSYHINGSNSSDTVDNKLFHQFINYLRIEHLCQLEYAEHKQLAEFDPVSPPYEILKSPSVIYRSGAVPRNNGITSATAKPVCQYVPNSKAK